MKLWRYLITIIVNIVTWYVTTTCINKSITLLVYRYIRDKTSDWLMFCTEQFSRESILLKFILHSHEVLANFILSTGSICPVFRRLHISDHDYYPFFSQANSQGNRGWYISGNSPILPHLWNVPRDDGCFSWWREIGDPAEVWPGNVSKGVRLTKGCD